MHKLIFILLTFFILSCSEKTYYSGKIIDKKLDINNLYNKDQVIKNFGQPSFINVVEDKLYYFSEKYKQTNLLNQKLAERKLIAFTISNNKVISIDQYDLDDAKYLTLTKETTENNLIDRGLIQKIFGGVTSNKVSNASQN